MPELFDSNYFSGQGPVFLGPYLNGTDNLEFIGDVSQVEFPANVSRTDVIENVTGNRNTAASFRNRIEYPLTITMKSVKPAHLARAIGGTVTSKTAASVTDEAVTGYHDKFLNLAHVKTSNLVLTDGTGVTTFTANTDYVLHADEGMVEILSTGAITDGQSLLADYDYAAQSHILVNPTDEDLVLVCPAINRANSGKRGRLTLYKINLDPGSVAAIVDGDTEGAATITGKVLLDATRAANDQLYRWEMED
jgi:hypothetical protein